MTPKRKTKYARQPQSEIQAQESSLTLISTRPRLNHLLRSRCRVFFAVFAIFAMAVVIRCGISASRGYALVATQNQAQELELENERLRVEIAQLKSPERIKTIAEEKLGMTVPNKMYFSHER